MTQVIELHVSATLQMNTTADLRLMSAFWELYIERLGFRFWYLHANPGGPEGRDRVLPLPLRRLGLDPGVPAYEVGLRREAEHCQGARPKPP